MTPFDFVNSINSKSGHILDSEPENIRYYDPYIVNKAFSFFYDTILIANMLNMYPDLPKKPHYDFLYNVVSKGKRFGGKWPKKNEDENVQRLAEFYKIKNEMAAKYLQMMTSEQIEFMMSQINEGGNVGSKSIRNKTSET